MDAVVVVDEEEDSGGVTVSEGIGACRERAGDPGRLKDAAAAAASSASVDIGVGG